MSDGDPTGGITKAKRPRPSGLRPPWKPGQSGNPGGRPKGLSGMIRDLTNDGTDIWRVVSEVLHGSHGAKARDRLDAAQMLADRLYGRAVETAVQVRANIDATAATLPELDVSTLEALARLGSGASDTQAGTLAGHALAILPEAQAFAPSDAVIDSQYVNVNPTEEHDDTPGGVGGGG